MSTVNGAWRGPNIIKNGLVLYLDANSGTSYSPYTSGTNWRDISGNGNTATLNNGPTFSNANGGIIVFDGSNDTYSLGSFRIGATSSFTISCWFKRNILSSMNTKFLLKTDTGNGGRIWFGVIDESNIYGTLWNNTYYTFGTTRDYWHRASNALTNTNWHQLVLAQDKTALFQKSYFDGIEAASSVLSGNLDNITSFNYVSTEINASISNLQIYNRALSATEVLQNYNATKTRFGL